MGLIVIAETAAGNGLLRRPRPASHPEPPQGGYRVPIRLTLPDLGRGAALLAGWALWRHLASGLIEIRSTIPLTQPGPEYRSGQREVGQRTSSERPRVEPGLLLGMLFGYGFDGAFPDPVFALPVTGSERALSSRVVAASTQSFNVSRGPHLTLIFASPIFM